MWEIDSLTWFSYLASGAEVAGAVAIGAVGVSIVRRRGLASFADDRTTARVS